MIKCCRACGTEFRTNRSARDYCSRSCSNGVIARAREGRKAEVSLVRVWSCGAGVQSTAIAALIVRGDLPKPDHAIMVNNHWEKRSTWEYVNAVLQPRLREIGLNLQIVNTLQYSSNRLFDASGHLLMPAYQERDGQVIKFKTHCCNMWKETVSRRWMRAQGIGRAETWIGISADEPRRLRVSDKRWNALRYPLAEMSMGREDCLYLIGQMGWPKPSRTSCVMCPQHDDATWSWIKRSHPADWERVLRIERYIRKQDPSLFLHRRLAPLAEVFP